MLKIRVKGISTVQKMLKHQVPFYGSITMYRGLVEAADIILADAKSKAPKDTGTLRGSGFVVAWRKGFSPFVRRKGQAKGRRIHEQGNIELEQNVAKATLVSRSKPPSVILGFGASYAAYVHEGYPPNANWKNGGPKFLEKAMTSNKSKVMGRIAMELKSRFK